MEEIILTEDEGDIIMMDTDPFVIEDIDLVNKVKEVRTGEIGVVFEYQGHQFEITQDIQGKILRKTMIKKKD